MKTFDAARIIELTERYNRPAPRYTSYPTAPHFTDAFDEADAVAALARSNETRPRRDLSLYLHLPFCRQLCWYCGCHTFISRSPKPLLRYLDVLDQEMALWAEYIDPDRPVRQVHWGGGTPTYLSPEQIVALGERLRARFPFAEEVAMSLEADPRGLTREHLTAAREAGFQRISFGVQDFDERVQEAINRIQPVDLVARVTTWAREAGFDGINYDLVYGLPHQTLASYDRTLDCALALTPDRFSVFSYAHVPWMKPHQKLIPEDALPAPEVKLRLFLRIIGRLEQAGYRHVGMDHFARPDDPLCIAQDEGRLHRNFQGYETHGHLDVVALGASGISQLTDAYVQNEKDLPAYYEAVEEGHLPTLRGVRLTDDDQRRRHVITRLMCDFRLDWAQAAEALGLDARAYFAEAVRRLKPLADDGLVDVKAEGVQVTPTGRLFIRNIAAAFDAYLPADAVRPQPMYSQTV